MATFLELSRMVASDSGTVNNVAEPQTVTGATGRLARIIGWTSEAYEEIQNESNWRWLEEDFEGTTIAGVNKYDASAMGIQERFGEWIHNSEDRPNYLSSQKVGEPRSTEGYLTFCDWREFRRGFQFGAAAEEAGKPLRFSIDSTGRIVLHPKPDAAYTLRGRYRKAPQVLAQDNDIPEMPAKFHKAIKWRALMLMGIFDENTIQQPQWAQNYLTMLDMIRRDQLDPIRLGGPLA